MSSIETKLYYLFNKRVIHAMAPARSAVYGIHSLRTEVLIGEAGNLRATLLQLHRDVERLGIRKPTAFTFELCPARERRRRTRELVDRQKNRTVRGEAKPARSRDAQS